MKTKLTLTFIIVTVFAGFQKDRAEIITICGFSI